MAKLTIEKLGYEGSKKKTVELGTKVRTEMSKRGFIPVAAEDCFAPGVGVYYDTRKDQTNNMVVELKQKGVQIVGGVPLMLGEFSEKLAPRFRIGLFGVDKWENVDDTVSQLMGKVDEIIAKL